MQIDRTPEGDQLVMPGCEQTDGEKIESIQRFMAEAIEKRNRAAKLGDKVFVAAMNQEIDRLRGRLGCIRRQSQGSLL